MLVWNAWALPALAAAALAFAMAAFVHLTRPDRVQNRRLALMLVFEGATLLFLGGGMWIVDQPDVVLGLAWFASALVVSKCFVYVSFLATLDTPLARPLRTRAARILILEGAVGGFLIGLLAYREWFVGVVPGGAVAPWLAVPGRLFLPLMAQGVGVLFLLGLVFSLSAWRHARTEHARRQARMFAIAFGTRDVLFAIWAFSIPHAPPTASWYFHAFVAVNYIWFVYIPLVAYGILKTQLFDIDLRLKIAMKRSTVGAIFVGMFFVATSIAQEYLSESLGFLAGGAAAGLLVFALSPLQRLAARVADVAMPGVDGSPEYLAYKRMEVYRVAVEGAVQDGVVTERERAVLDRLRASLGIAESDALRLEREVAA